MQEKEFLCEGAYIMIDWGLRYSHKKVSYWLLARSKGCNTWGQITHYHFLSALKWLFNVLLYSLIMKASFLPS
jgi:hypothetical protein